MAQHSDIDSSTARILIMAAVEAERQAVLRGLQGDRRFDVMLAGAGPASAAARTAYAIADSSEPYLCVVSAGIAGGFQGKAEIGTAVVASEIIAADLGAETAEGYASLDTLGFGAVTRYTADEQLTARLVQALKEQGVPAVNGPILTVSTVTGSVETAATLAARIPGAAAEAMEGFGVAEAAQHRGIPFLEVRTISNTAGPRDRASWRIADALAMLEAVSKVLKEVL